MKKESKFPKLVGVIHLPPLPGAPAVAHLSPSDALQLAGDVAIREMKLFEQSGFDAVIVENFGDTPFFKTQVSLETACAFSIIIAALQATAKIPIGINVLRNDWQTALTLASVNDCAFIRVNVLAGVVATDQGLIEGCASALMRAKAKRYPELSVFADVHVKHAKTLSSDDITLAIEDHIIRSHANAVIVSGAGTGKPVDVETLKASYAKSKSLKTPLYIGSGVTDSNVELLKPHCDGVIVSSCLRQNGIAGAPLDLKRVKSFVNAFRKTQKTKKTKRKK